MKLEECPVTRTLEVMGGKWKPIILFYLRDAPARSGVLARRVPQASGKMLTQQLRELEKDGLVKRQVFKQVPPKVEYSLTPLGRSLNPVLIAMCRWGEAHSDAPPRGKKAQTF